MKIWEIGGIALVCIGCATSEKAANRQTFEVSQAWVSDLTDAPLTRFRKIDRFEPYESGDLLIVGSPHSGIMAIEKDTGHKVWSLPIQYGVEAAGAGIKDRFFVGTLSGELISIDVKTGQLIWSTHVSNEVTAQPLIDNGFVYVMAANTLYCVDAADGKVVWVYQRPEITGLSVRGGTRPAKVDDRIFAGFSDGYLMSFDSLKGNVLWEVQLNRNKRFRDIDANIVASGKDLIVSGYDDKLYRVEQTSGAVKWSYEAGGYTAPLVIENIVYYSTTGGKILAINQETDKVVWSYNVKSGIGGTPKIFGSELAIGESNGRLIFLDRQTGRLTGFFEPGRGVFSPLYVDENHQRVYFISNESRAYMLTAGWKKPVWFAELLGKKQSW